MMKRLPLALGAVIFLAPLAFTQKSADPFKTEDQKAYYALGVLIARQIKQNIAVFDMKPADYKFFLMGMKDALADQAPKVDTTVYGPKLNAMAQAKNAAKTAQEKRKAKGFLDKMVKEPGAQVSPSGLIYFEVKAGTGPAPSAMDSVRILYTGTLVDGTVFDSTSQRGSQPLEHPVGQFIRCWTEGLQKMRVGGKAKLVCPSEIAYGERGTGAIPGGATLVFEIELVDVVKP